MDAFLYWVFWRVGGAEFDMEPYPNIRGHARPPSEEIDIYGIS